MIVSLQKRTCHLQDSIDYEGHTVVAVVVVFFVFQYVVFRFFHVVFVICNVLSCFLPFLWSRKCFSFLLKRFEGFVTFLMFAFRAFLELAATVSGAAPPNEAAALPPKNGDLSLVKEFFVIFSPGSLDHIITSRCRQRMIICETLLFAIILTTWVFHCRAGWHGSWHMAVGNFWDANFASDSRHQDDMTSQPKPSLATGILAGGSMSNYTLVS